MCGDQLFSVKNATKIKTSSCRCRAFVEVSDKDVEIIKLWLKQ